jgi:probable phosphoglycerate mutase
MIYIVRHGQTQWNLQGKKQGWKDSPLTHKGIQQGFDISKLLKQTLRGTLADYKVVISPLWRCQQFASIICEELGYDYKHCIIEQDLKEHGFGDWEGKTEEEINREYPGAWDDRLANRWHYIAPGKGGENYSTLFNRVQSVYEKYKDQNVVFVCHEMVSKVLRGMMLNMPTDEIPLQKHRQNKIYIFDGTQLSEAAHV